MDILLILIVASMLTFAGMIVSEKKKGLGFFTVVLSTCATMGLVRDNASYGGDFILMFVPLIFILLMSIIIVIRVGTE